MSRPFVRGITSSFVLKLKDLVLQRTMIEDPGADILMTVKLCVDLAGHNEASWSAS